MQGGAPTYGIPSRYTYIIRKSSRSNITPYSCGMTCDEARVPCECLYTNRNEALSDANRLTQVNPIGFNVVRIARLRVRKPSYFYFNILKTYLELGLIK